MVQCIFTFRTWLYKLIHLPLPHPIDVNKLKDNPSNFTTQTSKRQRKMMLEGKRPGVECSYCWKIEDIGRDSIFDRIYKSRIYKEEDIFIKDLPWTDDIIPKT